MSEVEFLKRQTREKWKREGAGLPWYPKAFSGQQPHQRQPRIRCTVDGGKRLRKAVSTALQRGGGVEGVCGQATCSFAPIPDSPAQLRPR